MRRVKKRPPILNELQSSGIRLSEPERLLWLAVVAQAVVDATALTPSRERNSARSIILSSVGATVSHFRAICDYAGIDPTFVVRFTKGAIAEGKSVPQLAVSYALSLGKEPK